MATLYYNDAQTDGNLSNLLNWWQDSGGTIQALALPGSDDIAEADSVAMSSGTCDAGTFLFNAPTLTGGTYNGTGTITGGYIAGGTFNEWVILTGTIFVDSGPTFNALCQFNGDGSSWLQGGTYAELEFLTTGGFNFNAANPTFSRVKFSDTWLEVAQEPDYPAESDVRLGVDYADSTMTGTLAIASKAASLGSGEGFRS